MSSMNRMRLTRSRTTSATMAVTAMETINKRAAHSAPGAAAEGR